MTEKKTTTKASAPQTEEELAKQRLETQEKAAEKNDTPKDVPLQNASGLENPDIHALAAAAAAGAQKIDSTPQSADEAYADDEDFIETTELEILIERDPMTKIPAKILAHELPIVMAVNSGSVSVVAERDVEVTDFDPDEELERLKRKYGTKAETIIANVYGMDGSRIAEEVGVPYSRVRGARYKAPAEASHIYDHASAENTIVTPRASVRTVGQRRAAQDSAARLEGSQNTTRPSGNRVSTRTNATAANRRSRS